MFSAARLGFVLLGCLAGTAVSADEEGAPPPGTLEAMDYGSVMGETIRAEWPAGNVAHKGLAIRLEHDAAMVFDIDLLRWSAGTRGGWVDISRTGRTSYKGSRVAATEGDQIFGSALVPGWSRSGVLEDPRADRAGPLPDDWGRWRGYFLHGNRVLLSFRVGETEIVEAPSAVALDGGIAFVRSIHLQGAREDLTALVGELPAEVFLRPVDGALVAEGEEGAFYIWAESDGPDVELRLDEEGRVEAHISASAGPALLKVVVAHLRDSSPETVAEARQAVEATRPDVEELAAGGPRRWAESVVAPVKMAEDDKAYVVDEIGLPMENPYGSWIRPSGFDFFSDGRRVAMSTWNGDIWTASGLGEGEMKEVTWQRVAAGLYFPMGVAIVDDVIYVTERGQLTRLHDLNGDGEADFFENLNNEGVVYPRAHSLALEVDSAGNFYFFKNGNRTPGSVPGHGALIRVSPDGSQREVVAQGIRGANTLAIGPGDIILGADQQGDWVPSTRIDWLRPGRFYGYRSHGAEGVAVGEFEPPVCWIPHRVDNSSGGMVFAGDERWGPLAGNWAHSSYGQCTLFALYTEMKGDLMQGGVVQFPLKFSSGLMRARMNPGDGQLYLMGMRGWQTLATEDGSFDRVRYTGLPNRMPVSFSVEPLGLRLTFSEPIDPVSATPGSFDVSRWGYVYSASYGSPEMSVANPGEQGRDPVEVSEVRLEDDGRTVFLKIPDIAPVMQMQVGYQLTFSDGGRVENTLYHTIHRLGDEPTQASPPEIAAGPAPAAPDLAEEAPEEELVPTSFTEGQETFEDNCIVCHQPTGGGVAPALATSKWAGGAPEALIRIVLHGKEGSQGAMMPFGWMSDEELANVLSFIRTHWHDKEPVTANEVKEVRAATAGRTALWKNSELTPLVEELQP